MEPVVSVRLKAVTAAAAAAAVVVWVGRWPARRTGCGGCRQKKNLCCGLEIGLRVWVWVMLRCRLGRLGERFRWHVFRCRFGGDARRLDRHASPSVRFERSFCCALRQLGATQPARTQLGN